MATVALTHPSDDDWSSTVIFISAFLFLLPVALAAQMLMLHWRTWLPGAEAEKSLIGGVKAAVYTFMSQLI
jgi:light-harvesting complex 1 beta chain